jgi:hypothetical protein
MTYSVKLIPTNLYYSSDDTIVVELIDSSGYTTFNVYVENIVSGSYNSTAPYPYPIGLSITNNDYYTWETNALNTYYENALMANDTIENSCCLGAILEFEITQLKPEPYRYSFEFVELTTNTNVEDIIIQDAKYSDYTIPKPGTTTNETISVRRAILPINLAILNNQQNISIFKFSVMSVTQNNKKLLEKIVTIKCQSEII